MFFDIKGRKYQCKDELIEINNFEFEIVGYQTHFVSIRKMYVYTDFFDYEFYIIYFAGKYFFSLYNDYLSALDDKYLKCFEIFRKDNTFVNYINISHLRPILNNDIYKSTLTCMIIQDYFEYEGV